MSSPILNRLIQGKSVPHTPVWFMRQAGSHFPGHAELFDQHGVRGITTTPELNTKVTLLPIKKLNVDAAVMYADIILPLEDMGIEFHYGEGETGPKIHNPIENPDAVDNLRILNPSRGVPYILETIRNVRAELEENRALIGFSGGPFTLAAYIIEGEASRNFPKTKQFMHTNPDAFRNLMEKLSASITTYLRAQFEAGVDVLQLFDSWIGVLAPEDFESFVLPYIQTIFENLSDISAPTVMFGTQTSGFLDHYVASGADVLSFDWRLDFDNLADWIGTDYIVQGNMDPSFLFAPAETIVSELDRVLKNAQPFNNHIFNLGHRIPMGIEPDILRRVVEEVHERTSKKRVK